MPNDLPTGLWVESQCAVLNAAGTAYYITQKGNHGSGVIMLKLLGRAGGCKLLIQQRDLDGDLGWVNALDEEIIAESKADEYIHRTINRDPDIWVIEIETTDMNNPFEG